MNDGIKDGGFAFPQPIAINSAGDVEHSEIPGMSLRDYFAASFDPVGVEMSNSATARVLGEALPDMEDPEAIIAFGLRAAAKVCYIYADAMLEARVPKLAGEISALDELGTIRLDVVLALSDMDKGREGNVNLRLEDIKRRIDKALARAGEKS